MALVQISTFGGISPKISPRLLQDTQAQVAVNCAVFSGTIIPLPGVGSTAATLTKTGTPKTIYRFGQDLISDANYWFHWTTDVDVARSQIAGDTSEWTFYTDGTLPKATYNTLALSGTDYPTVSRPLGLPAPTAACTVTAGTAPEGSTATPETRVYSYTLVSKESGYEFESAPAAASAGVEVVPEQPVTVDNFAALPSGYNVTHRRIYRSTAGSFLFVAEITAAATSYEDVKLAEDLGEEVPSLTWLQPPAELKGLINLPNGIMAGFKGRDVYFCDPYHPHAWPVQYQQSLDYPVVGLGRMDTTLAVLTTGSPYIIQGSHPDSMTVIKSDLEQSCVSKRSIVSFNGAVIYASPDGLVLLSSSGSKVITEQYFIRSQWQAFFKPESIHAYQHDLKYVAFYDTGTVQGGFIYDTTSGVLTMHDIYATAGYNDLQNDKLFLTFADRAVKPWLEGSAKSFVWRSKKFTFPKATSMACAQLDAEAYPVTVKFYVDGTLVDTEEVASRLPFRIASASGRDWEVQIEGNTEVFGFAMAQSMTELSGV
jgi:hypothetical protein